MFHENSRLCPALQGRVHSQVNALLSITPNSQRFFCLRHRVHPGRGSGKNQGAAPESAPGAGGECTSWELLGKKLGRRSGVFPENPGCSSWNGIGSSLGSSVLSPSCSVLDSPIPGNVLGSVTSHFPAIPSSDLAFGMLELFLVVPLASSSPAWSMIPFPVPSLS